MIEDFFDTDLTSIQKLLEYEGKKLIEDVRIVQDCCKEYNMGIIMNHDYYATFPDEDSTVFDQQETIEAIMRILDYCYHMHKIIILTNNFPYVVNQVYSKNWTLLGYHPKDAASRIFFTLKFSF